MGNLYAKVSNNNLFFNVMFLLFICSIGLTSGNIIIGLILVTYNKN